MYHILEDSNLYNVSQRVSHLKGRVYIRTTPVFGCSLFITYIMRLFEKGMPGQSIILVISTNLSHFGAKSVITFGL